MCVCFGFFCNCNFCNFPKSSNGIESACKRNKPDFCLPSMFLMFTYIVFFKETIANVNDIRLRLIQESINEIESNW